MGPPSKPVLFCISFSRPERINISTVNESNFTSPERKFHFVTMAVKGAPLGDVKFCTRRSYRNCTPYISANEGMNITVYEGKNIRITVNWRPRGKTCASIALWEVAFLRQETTVVLPSLKLAMINPWLKIVPSNETKFQLTHTIGDGVSHLNCPTEPPSILPTTVSSTRPTTSMAGLYTSMTPVTNLPTSSQHAADAVTVSRTVASSSSSVTDVMKATGASSNSETTIYYLVAALGFILIVSGIAIALLVHRSRKSKKVPITGQKHDLEQLRIESQQSPPPCIDSGSSSEGCDCHVPSDATQQSTATIVHRHSTNTASHGVITKVISLCFQSRHTRLQGIHGCQA